MSSQDRWGASLQTELEQLEERARVLREIREDETKDAVNALAVFLREELRLDISTAKTFVIKNLKKSLEMIDVEVVDHVIVSAGKTFSFLEKGIMTL